jgi:hypothetical protein
MSKLILAKTESVQLFLTTRYINDVYRNPFTDSLISELRLEDDLEDD